MRKKLLTIVICGIAFTSSAAPTVLSITESIKDDAIVYPESFETDTQELMKNWYLKNYAVLDDNVEHKPSNDVSDQEYIKRLKAIPTTIEMPYNQVVRSYIDMYVNKRRSLVESMLGLGTYYMPIFEQALEKQGLPLELKYLPIIESALKPDAVSRAGATGLWQFMLATARGLNMEVNTLVDERRDPYRSSEKAAEYLKTLHGIYGDWALALAAYNCGPGNINKAIRRAGGGTKGFWEIYPYLPAETRGYVPAFIATTYIMTYHNKHNISTSLSKRPLITDTVHVTKRVNLRQISEVLNIPLEEIKILNPHFRKEVIPGDYRPYVLALPSQQIYSYIMSEDSIVKYNENLYARRDVVEPASFDNYNKSDNNDVILVVKYHKVKKGETLSKVARKYGVSSTNIKKWNGIRGNSLKRGQTIKINTYKANPNPKEEEIVVEQENETLLATNDAVVNEEVTQEQEVTQEVAEDPQPVVKSTKKTVEPKKKIAQNKKEKGALSTREKAEKAKETETAQSKKKNKKDKETTKKKKKSAAKKSYVVKSGENLSKIAERNGVSVSDIQKANKIKGSSIRAGQKLIIPKN